jgi:hypothetical protein
MVAFVAERYGDSLAHFQRATRAGQPVFLDQWLQIRIAVDHVRHGESRSDATRRIDEAARAFDAQKRFGMPSRLDGARRLVRL